MILYKDRNSRYLGFQQVYPYHLSRVRKAVPIYLLGIATDVILRKSPRVYWSL